MSSVLHTLAVATIGAVSLVGCGGSASESGGAPSETARASASTSGGSAAPMDTSDPAKFIATLQSRAKTNGSCFVQQTRGESQFTDQVTLGLTEPVVARLMVSAAAGETFEPMTVLIVDGKTYSKSTGQPSGLWRVGDVGPLKELVGEMDCGSVFDDLEAAVTTVEAGDVETIRDQPAQTYVAEYDVAAWTSAHGEALPSGLTQRLMTLAVRDGSLVRVATDLDGGTVTDYSWTQGDPDVVAPPKDQIDP